MVLSTKKPLETPLLSEESRQDARRLKMLRPHGHGFQLSGMPVWKVQEHDS